MTTLLYLAFAAAMIAIMALALHGVMGEVTARLPIVLDAR